MTSPPRILVFAGSAREASYNKKLARVAAEAVRAAGAAVTFVDLKDFPMPLYNGDLEEQEGLPENAKKLKTMMREHGGFLVACPEYNGSITALLKNTLDWASRRDGEEGSVFSGKVAALVSASPGPLGGMRAVAHVRVVLGNLGMLVLPGQKNIRQAHQAFDDDGKLRDPKDREAVEALAAQLVDVVRRLKS